MMMPPIGARQITGREDAQRLQLAQPVGHVGREEQRAQNVGEENVDDEVVELQRAAQRRQAERLVIVFVEGSLRRGRRKRVAAEVMLVIA